jgi:DNA replication and repair protein RecF
MPAGVPASGQTATARFGRADGACRLKAAGPAADGAGDYATIRPAMQIRHLSLRNFRNFIRLETDLPSGATLLVGANAQGKTSLLEAIHYLSAAHSPHTSHDRQLINFLALEQQPPVARVVAEIDRAGQLHRIEIRIILEPSGPNGNQRLRKEVLINGVRRRVGDLAGGFNSVLFLPQDLRILEGSPGDRRRQLDSALAQGEMGYASALGEYARVLTHRNALLKRLQERQADPNQLAYWDEQLSRLGSGIMRSRALAVAELGDLLGPLHSHLTRSKESLRLAYLPAVTPQVHLDGQLSLPTAHAPDLSAMSLEAVAAELLESLAQRRVVEIARGMTTIGPHRDDLLFLANGINLSSYGSRGQIRTALLALKLAEAEWLGRRSGDPPVILLDEILAELDAQRREDVLQKVGAAGQALLTAAEVDLFPIEFRRDTTIWQIRQGTIVR